MSRNVRFDIEVIGLSPIQASRNERDRATLLRKMPQGKARGVNLYK